jgi:hypothetical protein
MDLAYLRVITATHLAFVIVFAFFFWQKRTRFAGALTCAWLMQALRIVPLMRQASGASVSMPEWLLGDVLFPPAIWCLLVSGGEVLGRRTRTLWGAGYIGASVSLVIVGHLWGTLIAERLVGLPPDRAEFWAVLVRHVALFIPGGLIALWLAAALLRGWLALRLPGALIASLAAVPYTCGILAVPFQWWFSYYPSWALLAWFLQVLGMSTGFLVVILNLEHVALERSQENVRRLRGMLPICAWCKKVRDDSGYWREIEVYVRDHSEADFTHGLCPACHERLDPASANAPPGDPGAAI